MILPGKSLDLVERDVIQFVQRREKLSAHGQATKKGLLFYGPPDSGSRTPSTSSLFRGGSLNVKLLGGNVGAGEDAAITTSR